MWFEHMHEKWKNVNIWKCEYLKMTFEYDAIGVNDFFTDYWWDITVCIWWDIIYGEILLWWDIMVTWLVRYYKWCEWLQWLFYYQLNDNWNQLNDNYDCYIINWMTQLNNTIKWQLHDTDYYIIVMCNRTLCTFSCGMIIINCFIVSLFHCC